MNAKPSAIGIACFAILQTAAAGPCDVVNKSPGEAVIKVAGKSETLAAGAWTPLPDCANLQVEKGPVQIRGVVGGVPQKTLCPAGPCVLPPASKSLVVSGTSSYRLVPGGHRMDKDVMRKAGIPKGEIYALEAAAQFDLSALSGAPAAFALYEARAKTPLYQTKLSEPRLTIPLEHLRRGAKYAWEVYGAGGRAQKLAAGGFDLMSEQDAAAIASELAALEQSGERGAAEKMLDELAVYVAHDLTYEIEMLRATLRSQQ